MKSRPPTLGINRSIMYVKQYETEISTFKAVIGNKKALVEVDVELLDEVSMQMTMYWPELTSKLLFE